MVEATPSQTELNKSIPEKSADTLLAEGRRDYICGDYNNASDHFSQACEALTLEFGDRAVETAEGYYWYGKALWELNRGQQDFLGDRAGNDKVEPAEDKENVKPEEPEEKESKSKEEQETEQIKEKLSQVEVKSQEEEKNDENEENEEIAEENAEEKEEINEIGADGDAPTLGEEDTEEEVSDAQLAYEMFELARSIYTEIKDQTKEIETKKAECLLSLGEISAENGLFENAITDYNTALEIFEKNYSKTHRRTAEVFFSLGCAHDAIYQYDKSKTCFETAISGLENRVKEIEAKEEGARKASEKRDLKSISEDVLPELKARLEDALHSEQKHLENKKILKEYLLQTHSKGANPFDESSSSKSSSVSKAPAQSLNHLVKRKRKNVTEMDSDEPVVKKA